ncbi:hypothetical protein OAO18_08565, partial [Francisellaceae bacterium]|nr:hypothetical protein [Francisellaceae bacterium]
LTDNKMHFGADITAEEINGLPPQYQQLVKMTFGDKDLDLFFDINEKTDYDNKGLGSEFMNFGIQNMGNVKAYLNYNYTDKLYVKQVVEYIQKSIDQYNEAQEGEISQQRLTQESFESEKMFAKNIKINKAGLVINNQTLIQDLIKLYATMAGQQPDKMKAVVSQQLSMFASQSQSDFSRDFFDSLANYINDPKTYEVTFIPKGTVTYNEIMENYFNAVEEIQKKNHVNTNNQNKATVMQKQPNQQINTTQPQAVEVDQYSAAQKAYENTLKLFHYQFNVNGKQYK